MKNRKKQKLSLKKITITKLRPDIMAKLGGGKGEKNKGSDPTEIILQETQHQHCTSSPGFQTEITCESVQQCAS